MSSRWERLVRELCGSSTGYRALGLFTPRAMLHKVTVIGPDSVAEASGKSPTGLGMCVRASGRHRLR